MTIRNLCFGVIMACSGMLSLQAQTSQCPIIPRPQEVRYAQGAFQLSDATCYRYSGGQEAREAAEFFVGKLQKDMRISLRKGKSKTSEILFCIDKTIEGDEAYRLDISNLRVEARAKTGAGLYYAAQSLLQLLPAEALGNPASASAFSIPCQHIIDAPRFAYRGVMLDPCRHFLSVEDVKAQIERLATYKINHLHWHLTDDQGWRVEIKKYPLLTEVGAWRTEGDGSRYGGYYTQDDIREVVNFARRHHVEIVPELEMPGHEMAAIAAYPYLSCKGEETTPRIIWGVEDVVLCPGRETTFTFLKDVIDEMLPLFPGTLFHIGGDESPRGEWATCDSCQARKQALGYERESQLQSYVIERIGSYLAQHGRRLVGWDEILEGGGLDTSAIVMSWRGEAGGITAARMNHHVLMTPSSHGMYFDQFQSNPSVEPMAIGGYSTLKTVYSYDPVPKELKENGRAHYVMGVQANCWSEYMLNVGTLEYRLYPRALALAEVAWTQPENKDYADFERRVDNEGARRLHYMGAAQHIPPVEQEGACLDHVVFTDSAIVRLTTVRPERIVYTLNGQTPTAASVTYTEPLVLTKTTEVKCAAILPCGLMSPVRTIHYEKQSLSETARTGKLRPGLMLKKWEGFYASPFRLEANKCSEVKHVDRIEALRLQNKRNNAMRGLADYAAEVSGYVSIPTDGVNEFATNNVLLWIDGTLVIDNSQLTTPRHYINKGTRALKSGLHEIKVVFLGGIYNGWPSYWDDAAVKMRPFTAEGTNNWQTITPDLLFCDEE